MSLRSIQKLLHDKVTKQHSDLLRHTEIHNGDYQDIFNITNPDDFIFLDPPYDCIFSDYGNEEYREGFNEDAHKLLANNIKRLNCRVLMVIGRTPLTEELYGDMIVDEYAKSYSVNIRNSSILRLSYFGNKLLKIMARIDSKVLFMITSPRTPERMIPEIDLLHRNFNGQHWNISTQKAFMEVLRSEDFFFGEGEKDPAFSARDRINRAPKALGFVQLAPCISLTDAGEKLINSRYTNEIFLRQLLKFQIPSPFHVPSKHAANFWVKPYLEIFRLIRHFGSLKFDELWLFGMQLVDYRDFELIVKKIEVFRIAKAKIPIITKGFERNICILN